MATFNGSLEQFSFELYQRTDVSENACISPFSIISAILMLMAGTGGNSKTQIKSSIFKENMDDHRIFKSYKELAAQVFDDKENKLYLATKLFVKKGLTLKKRVRYVAFNYFRAGIGNVIFSESEKAAEAINRYIEKRTNNKIKDLIKPEWLDELTVLVLVNALYFKAAWQLPFNNKLTKDEDFYLTEQKTVKVKMMFTENLIPYYKGKDFAAVALPYKGKGYEMVIVLPDRKEGLSDLIKSFTSITANEIDTGLRKSFMSIKIPKFSFSSDTNLNEILMLLNITDIFDDKVADFTNLIENSDSNGVYVSKAVHKVVIEVNEWGTEAAAATGVVLTLKSVPRTFIADHPFMFYIKHTETDSPLFIGHYKGPN